MIYLHKLNILEWLMPIRQRLLARKTPLITTIPYSFVKFEMNGHHQQGVSKVSLKIILTIFLSVQDRAFEIIIWHV